MGGTEVRELAAAHQPAGSGVSIDLLIPTRNRHDCLARSLASWRQAASGRAGIILCDQSARPFQAEDVVTLHRPDLAGLPAARNALLAASHAEVVVFLDDDCEIAADFVARIAELATREPRSIAWGPVVETRGVWTRRAHRLVHLGAFHDERRLLQHPHDRATGALFGCCFAVRRREAAQVGFDARRPGYALGEDLDFFRRLAGANPGRIIRFARRLRAIHRQDGADRADAYRRGLGKGAFLAWLARRHGQGNPATLLHLGLAVLAAASGRGQEPADWRGVLRGLHEADGHGRLGKNRAP